MLGYAEDCQLIDDNALRGVTSGKIGGSAGAIGKRFLTVPEIVRVWQALDIQEEAGLLGKHLSTAIKVLILTGARRDEVAGMRWQELDLQSGTWEIDSERTKNRRPHTVYLTPEIIQLLQNLEMFEDNDFVFSGQGGGVRIFV
jgi:integrase